VTTKIPIQSPKAKAFTTTLHETPRFAFALVFYIALGSAARNYFLLKCPFTSLIDARIPACVHCLSFTIKYQRGGSNRRVHSRSSANTFGPGSCLTCGSNTHFMVIPSSSSPLLLLLPPPLLPFWCDTSLVWVSAPHAGGIMGSALPCPKNTGGKSGSLRREEDGVMLPLLSLLPLLLLEQGLFSEGLGVLLAAKCRVRAASNFGQIEDCVLKYELMENTPANPAKFGRCCLEGGEVLFAAVLVVPGLGVFSSSSHAPRPVVSTVAPPMLKPPRTMC
jgi:hypothetical protein